MNYRQTAFANRSLHEQAAGQQKIAEFDVKDAMNKPSKALEKYERVYDNNTEFFSTYNPDMIEEALVAYLTNDQVEFKSNKDKYKVKFTKRGTDDFDNSIQDNVDICVKILQVNDNKVCVEFTKLSGRQTTFLKHYENFKNSTGCLSFANDCTFDSVVA